MKLKSLLAIAAFLALQIPLHAQIKYEGSFDEGTQSILLENSELKYATYSKAEKAIVLYNSDHSLWKSVSLDLPGGLHFNELKSISKNVFNDDALIELAYTCVEYVSNYDTEVTTNHVNERYTLFITNEEGILVLESENSSNLKIVDTKGERKLWVYRQNGQDSDRKDNIDVYSLPKYHTSEIQNHQGDEYNYDTFGDRRGI